MASFSRMVVVLVGALTWSACTSQTTLRRQYVESVRDQRQGLHDDARQGYESILTASPDFEGARNNLAVLAIADGQATAALKLLRQELQAYPTQRSARLNEVLLLLAGDDNAAAIRASRALLGSFAGDPVAHLLHGVALLRTRSDNDEAIRVLTEALKADVSSVRARAAFARGVANARGTHWAAAAEDFGTAARLRRDAVAHFNRALSLVHTDDLAGAQEALGHSAALDDRAAAVPHLLAIVQHRRGDPKAAHASVERARKQEPARPGLSLLLGVIHYQAGAFDQATAAFLAETSITPASAAAWFDLGMARLEGEDLRAAHDAFATAASLAPDDKAAAHNRDTLLKLIE